MENVNATPETTAEAAPAVEKKEKKFLNPFIAWGAIVVELLAVAVIAMAVLMPLM